jgi:hypothetical protein
LVESLDRMLGFGARDVRSISRSIPTSTARSVRSSSQSINSSAKARVCGWLQNSPIRSARSRSGRRRTFKQLGYEPGGPCDPEFPWLPAFPCVPADRIPHHRVITLG